MIDDYLADVNRREREQIAARAEAQASEDPNDEVADAAFRRGSREITIREVEFLDAAGQPQPIFQTHGPLTIRIHYHAQKPVVDPVFGVGIHTENGIWISGPNTRFDTFVIARVHGPGYVDYHIPELPLLRGRYPVSIAVVDSTMLHPFDMHDRLYTLNVQSDGMADQYGMITIAHRWSWSG